MLATDLEREGQTFCSAGSIPQMHMSIINVTSITSTARFSTIPNQAFTDKGLVRTNKGTISSTLTTSQFSVRNDGHLIYLVDTFHLGGRKYVLLKLGFAPVLSKLSTVIKAFNITLTKTWTEKAGLRNNDAT